MRDQLVTGSEVAEQLAAFLDSVVERAALRVVELEREQRSSSDERSPWLGIDKAAEYLDWPRQRIYKLTAQGAIPHYKHERRLLFRRDELDRWLADCAEGGAGRDWMDGR